ncbi:hypothetical protein Ancab_018795 [Ancistrocladus abbreviatus]
MSHSGKPTQVSHLPQQDGITNFNLKDYSMVPVILFSGLGLLHHRTTPNLFRGNWLQGLKIDSSSLLDKSAASASASAREIYTSLGIPTIRPVDGDNGSTDDDDTCLLTIVVDFCLDTLIWVKSQLLLTWGALDFACGSRSTFMSKILKHKVNSSWNLHKVNSS